MLVALKSGLAADLRVRLLELRELELTWLLSNIESLATHAALVAGFAHSGLFVAQHLRNTASLALQLTFILSTTITMGISVSVCFGATCCAMLGPGRALRGHDGAVDVAADGLVVECRVLLGLFTFGILGCCLTSVVYIFIAMDVGTALLLCATLALTIGFGARTCHRVLSKFRLSPHRAVVCSLAAATEQVPKQDTASQARVSMSSLIVEQASSSRRTRLGALDKLLGFSSQACERRLAARAKGNESQEGALRRILRNLEVGDGAWWCPMVDCEAEVVAPNEDFGSGQSSAAVR